MDVYCQFLRTDQEQKQGCASGVNFYDVGSGRELCLVCPLRELGDYLPVLPLLLELPSASSRS